MSISVFHNRLMLEDFHVSEIIYVKSILCVFNNSRVSGEIDLKISLTSQDFLLFNLDHNTQIIPSCSEFIFHFFTPIAFKKEFGNRGSSHIHLSSMTLMTSDVVASCVTPQTLPSINALICSAVNNSLKTIHFLLLSCTSVSHGLFSILWTS
ncbi:MAG: hypothetical protein WCG25_06070 [bacterium]